MSEQFESAIENRTIADLGRAIRSPDVSIGGGAAAAVAASLASSTAALVTKLSIYRKRNQPHQGGIRADLARLESLEKRFLEAADRDAQALARLMNAYASATSRDGSSLDDALESAALTSIEIAGLAADLCEVADRQIAHASRFTVSDLGAAAALARGAASAALLTAKVNVALMRGRPGASCNLTNELEATMQAIDERSRLLAVRAIANSSAAITGRKG